jgi:hypothetical protein
MGWLQDTPFTGRAQEMLHKQARDAPARILAQELALHFAPRGSLGLYVDCGSASFCNVRLEPLGRSD